MITVPSVLILSAVTLWMFGIIPRLFLLRFFPGAHQTFNELFAKNTIAAQKSSGLQGKITRALRYHGMWAGLTMIAIIMVAWIVLLVIFWKYVAILLVTISSLIILRDMVRQETFLIS